jgi:hypothetical protein
MPEAAKGRAAYAAVLSSCLEAAVVIIHAGNEPAPFVPGAPISHQRGGAILAGPVVVRHYVAQGDVVAHHQQRRQLGRLVVDDDRVMRGAFTHFNGYGVLVSRSGMVRMVAGFRSGDVLVGAELVHSKVPVQTAGFAAVQVTGVGIGVSFGVGGAVDGDEAGAHGGCALAGIRVFGHVGNFNAYFTAHLAGCAGNYRRLLNFKGDGRRPHFVVLRTAAERQGGEYGKKARPDKSIFHAFVLGTAWKDCKKNLELVRMN